MRAPGRCPPLALGLVLAVAGCAPRGKVTTATPGQPLSRANFRVLEKNVRGRDTGFALLGLIPFSSPSYADAMSDVRAKSGMANRAAALTNVTEDRSTIYVVLFSLPRITITADVIEFLPDTPSPPAGQPAGSHAAPAPPAAAPPPAVPAAPPPAGVRTYCVVASDRLNYAGGQAHPLAVLFVQLQFPDAFLDTDSRRLAAAPESVPGVVGAPVEHLVYPGSTITVEVAPHPNARLLGVLARYQRLTGHGRGYRDIRDAGPEADCIALGPNGLESP
jgi:hypothetical protein